MMDFTLAKFLVLCSCLQQLNYSFLTVSDYLKYKETNQVPANFIILRHDVDRWVQNAVKMAEAEAEAGIVSTYYFRYPATFERASIIRIHSLGHEIGYHYEVLSKNSGNESRALRDFENELSLFRSIVPVETICMHGNPVSRYDNRDLWKKNSFVQYGLLGEAYLSVQDVHYFTDTGRTWSGKRSAYDFMQLNEQNPGISNTDDLISWIRNASPPSLYLTVHPERWAPDWLRFMASLIMDILVNIVKGCIRLSVRIIKTVHKVHK